MFALVHCHHLTAWLGFGGGSGGHVCLHCFLYVGQSAGGTRAVIFPVPQGVLSGCAHLCLVVLGMA